MACVSDSGSNVGRSIPINPHMCSGNDRSRRDRLLAAIAFRSGGRCLYGWSVRSRYEMVLPLDDPIAGYCAAIARSASRRASSCRMAGRGDALRERRRLEGVLRREAERREEERREDERREAECRDGDRLERECELWRRDEFLDPDRPLRDPEGRRLGLEGVYPLSCDRRADLWPRRPEPERERERGRMFLSTLSLSSLNMVWMAAMLRSDTAGAGVSGCGWGNSSCCSSSEFSSGLTAGSVCVLTPAILMMSSRTGTCWRVSLVVLVGWVLCPPGV